MDKKYFFLPIVLCCLCLGAKSQGLTNNGAKIYLAPGVFLNGGNFINKTSVADGSIDLNGTMIVRGDWTNNAANNVFVNIEPTPNGTVFLASNILQNVGGSNPTHFENLHLDSSNKVLHVNDCEVNGILTINSILELNSNKLIIDNPVPNAITYNSGCIISESQPSIGLGEIEWKIGSAMNVFEVPFGVGSNGKDLNLVFKTTTAANPATGSITFATYPTNYLNNPLPTGVSSIDGLNYEEMADRFWEVSSNYTTNPVSDITFKYNSADIDPTNNPKIDETLLQAVRYNPSLGQWTDWGPSGLSNPATKTVTVSGITGENLNQYWGLVSKTIIPNAFTPDGDFVNDVFAKGYEMKIVNRWGQELYSGKDGWDGNYKNEKVSAGTYYYIITKNEGSSNETILKGSVLLIR